MNLGKINFNKNNLDFNTVLISHTYNPSYMLGETPVTQDLYYRVTASNPSKFTGNPNRPVEQVTLYDAMLFCNILSSKFNLEPYYNINNNHIQVNDTSSGFRLPTAQEWHFACTDYHHIKKVNILDIAWCKENSNSTTHPVATKRPNTWGLYDMCGNVDEWVIHHEITSCGGSWKDPHLYIPTAVRCGFPHNTRNQDLGFRIAKNL